MNILESIQCVGKVEYKRLTTENSTETHFLNLGLNAKPEASFLESFFIPCLAQKD
jgi:hypothetical protein